MTAAAASAMFILRLESASRAVKDSSALNAASLWVVSFASFAWCTLEGIQVGSADFPPLTMFANRGFTLLSGSLETTVNGIVETLMRHPIEILYLGGITTALANYIQTKAQGKISAERASIIYALDPVYGKKSFFQWISPEKYANY